MILLLIILGLTLWLSLMALVVALPIRPNIVRLTGRFVCPPGSKIEVETVVHSYHRGGEKGIIVSCVGPDGSHDVKVKALLVLWGMSFVLTLPLASLVGVWIFRAIGPA